jgi:hypothetical protein
VSGKVQILLVVDYGIALIEIQLAEDGELGDRFGAREIL